MDARSRPLWPVHLKPQPDELLSNWLVDLAHAHGMKVQTFCRLLFGSGRQVWNRDVDRLAPDWLLEVLSKNTGTSLELGSKTTLRCYEGVLFRECHDSSVLQWILPLRIYHRQRHGFGLQFCARCLADDEKPYFRKRWRVALCTWCAVHGVLLHDRCPACGAPVIFQRRELGRPKELDGGPIILCYACDYDLREAPAVPAVFYDESAREHFELAIRRLEGRAAQAAQAKPRDVRYYNVLHHLCWLLATRYRNVWLRDFARRKLGAPDMPITGGRLSFELRPVEERHYLLQLAFWCLAEPEPRLTAAWRAGAVTYSALLRDFEDRPGWYDKVVGRFSDWRSRATRHVQPRGESGRFVRL